MNTLILLRGLPGSGKSTLANLLAPNSTYEADDYFYDSNGVYNFDATKLKEAHTVCQDKTNACLLFKLNKIVIVSNTFTQEWEMEPYIKMAERHGYRVQTIISENRHKSDSIHGVPEESLQKMRERFEIKL
jgi:predicted kinase